MPSVQVRLTEFSELINSYTVDFVGREWLVEQVSAVLEDPGCRFVVLTGEPGVGKSAFAAHLAATHPQWLRYFIRRDSRELLRPGDGKTFFLTIGGQLATLHPEIFKPEHLEFVVRQRIGEVDTGGEAVGVRIKELRKSPFYKVSFHVEQEIHRVAGKSTGVEIGRLVTEDRLLSQQDLQYLGLLDPARLLYQTDPTAQIVVLVDALDELRFSPAETNILEALSQLPASLIETDGSQGASREQKVTGIPPNLRFVLTSRREKFLDRLLGRKDVRELRMNGEMNRADLHTYAIANVPAEKLDLALAHENKSRDLFIKELEDKAAGNFLYLRSVVRAIEEALANPEKAGWLPGLLRVEDLPGELEKLYDYFLFSIVTWIEKSFGQQAWRSFLRPLLGVLAVAREPLYLSQLTAITGLVEEDLGDLLRELRQFVEPVEGQAAFRIFHTSFADYLLDAESNTEYRIEASKWHRQVANYYWSSFNYDWSKCDIYGIRRLPIHLAKAGLIESLNELLTNFDWIDTKLNQMEISTLLADYTLTDDTAAKLVRDALRASTYAMAFDKVQLAGQLVGRLASFDSPTLSKLVQQARVWKKQPWLCPLTPSLTRPGGPLVRIMKGRAGGHTGTVRSLAITPDGHLAISAGNSSNDQTVRIWDLDTGNCLHILSGQAAAGGKTPLALSASGLKAFTAFGDEVRAWDLVSQPQQDSLSGSGDAITALATTTDGERVIIGTMGGSVRVWDMAVDCFDLANNGEPVFAVAISDDGSWGASVSASWVKVWDLTSRQVHRSLEITSGLTGGWNDAHLLWISANGDRVLLGNPLRSWDVELGTVADLLGHPLQGAPLVISADGQRALVEPFTSELVLAVWDLAHGEKLLEVQISNRVATVAMTRDGKRAISADYEHDLSVWDLSEDLQRPAQAASEVDLRFEAFTPSGNTGFFQLPDGRRELYSFEKSGLTPVPGPHDILIQAMSAEAKRRNDIREQTAKKLKLAVSDSRKPMLLVVSRDGRRAVSAFRTLHKLGDYEESVQAGDADQIEEITLWDRNNKLAAMPLRGHTRPVLTLDMTPDGLWAISAGWGRLVRVWNLETGAQRWVLQGHIGLVTAVAITPDGQRAASASEDGTLRLWDLQTGQSLAVFSGETWLIDCWLSPEGDIAVAAERTGLGDYKYHILRLCGG